MGLPFSGKSGFQQRLCWGQYVATGHFSHDVDGITPDPMFLFTEGRKSVALGVNFDYQNRWGADISYNNFFGGVGTTNAMADRDYVSFNIKYSI